MTDDSRPSTQSSDDLPRRVRGANWRVPGQQAEGAPPAERLAPQGPLDRASAAAAQPDAPLPRRVPGASDIKPPRRLALVQPLPETPADEPDAAATMPLPATSGSPGPYAAARRSAMSASPLRTAAALSAIGPSAGLGTAPPAADAPSAAAPTAPPPASPPAPAPVTPPARVAVPRQLAASRARRWWLAGVAACAIVALLVVVALYPRGHPAANPGSSRIATQSAVRDQAAAWVAGQVAHNVLVACDALTCADLAQHGFPAADLNVLQSTAPDLYGTQVVVATANVRSQFGARLASVFAPEVLASFGTGVNHIDIREVAADGPAAFRTALSADLRARISAAGQLLARSTVTTSARARSALAAGDVDSRLLTVLAFLGSQQPIHIVSFGGAGPGASPGVPLRVADLATAAADGPNSGSYPRTLMTLLRSEVPPYIPTSVATVRLASGQKVVQISYAAPSPLGLLG